MAEGGRSEKTLFFVYPFWILLFSLTTIKQAA